MIWGSDLTACARIVERGDPDRFLSVMASPLEARAVLFPIYAMNVEVSRSPWVTQEPMVAEMRLQWWRDVAEELASGGSVRRHEVTSEMARVIDAESASSLDEYMAVRVWDINKDPFEDAAHFERYINQSSGTLMWVAARALVPALDGAAEKGLRDLGYASGVANFLRAVPQLEARGRIPLLDGTHAGVRAMVEQALARLKDAQNARHAVPKAVTPALLAAWQAGAILQQAFQQPERVGQGTLGLSGAGKRLRLMLKSAIGRW